MNPTQVALYARVSSEQQAEAQPFASQVAVLRERRCRWPDRVGGDTVSG
jgi:hypothetical protein